MTTKTRPLKLLRILPKANRDLTGIHFHISKSSRVHADAFIAKLTQKMYWIAEVDFTGVPRDEIEHGLRALPYKDRCIYFRSYPDRIVVIRVLHGSQDIAGQSFPEG